MADPRIEALKTYGCDTQGALERFLYNEGLYGRFLDKFLADTSFGEIKPYIDAEDYENALKSVHTLKGVCGNLGLTPLYDVSCTMVDLFRAGDPEGAVSRYGQLAELYGDICVLIRKQY